MHVSGNLVAKRIQSDGGEMIFLLSVFLAAGGISESATEEWLANWSGDRNLAHNVMARQYVSPSNLVSLSRKWYVGEGSLVFIMRHPCFPQEERSRLIRKGKGYFYITNLRPGSFTIEDIHAYLDYADRWDRFRPYGVVVILMTPGLPGEIYRKAWHIFANKYERGLIFLPCSVLKKKGIRDNLSTLREILRKNCIPEDVKRMIKAQFQLIGEKYED